MNDFECMKLHDALRSLSWQLYDLSNETLKISWREDAGDMLPEAECSRRTRNRERMVQIEDLIIKISGDITLRRT
jgi:hypothetical protein